MTDHPIILFAMDRECRPFRQQFPEQRRLSDAPCRAWSCGRSGQTFLIMEIGVGPAKTRRALDWLVPPGRGRPGAPFLVMAGFAGSLAAGLHIGDVFVASEVVDMEGNRWPTAWPHASAMPANWTRGRLITTPRLIGDPAEKRRLSEVHAAEAVDMESAAVARFCTQHALPFGCVRTISDNVDDTLSPHLVSLLGNGQVSIPRLLATLLLHPSVIGSLLKLARGTRLASRTLAEALNRMLGIG